MIPLRDDDIAEIVESFYAQLSIPASSASIGVKTGPRDNATVNIVDNDVVSVQFDPIIYNSSECDGVVILTLRSSIVASFDYTVQVDTSNGTATGNAVCFYTYIYPYIYYVQYSTVHTHTYVYSTFVHA